MEKQKILGLRTCIYKVENLQEAKAWYTKAFDTSPYFDEPYYIGFNIGGFELGLQSPDEGQANQKAVNIMTYWGVENIEAAYQQFLDLGATPHELPMNVGGEIVVAAVKDPWNNVVGLIYNPAFKIG